MDGIFCFLSFSLLPLFWLFKSFWLRYPGSEQTGREQIGWHFLVFFDLFFCGFSGSFSAFHRDTRVSDMSFRTTEHCIARMGNGANGDGLEMTFSGKSSASLFVDILYESVSCNLCQEYQKHLSCGVIKSQKQTTSKTGPSTCY